MTARGTATRTVGAVDLGAESGRVAAVSFDGERLSMEIVHRFRHSPRVEAGALRWDIEALSQHITAGLHILGGSARDVASVGVDTWGVDYGLLDPAGGLLDAPICYRDERNVRAMRAAVTKLGADALYDATGIQLMPINTIFGLLSDVLDRPERLAGTGTMVMMPDVFHHLLSGSTVSEYTAVSTSGAYDMATNRWATGLLGRLGIPRRILPEVVPAGTDVGPLTGTAATGPLAGTRVVMPPGHDTACAVVAVPFAAPGALFISSGTWSLVGVEIDRAVITPASRQSN
ncbi:MAG: FGGY family carbohydrate kinase, partial [Sciscionella sp.]